MLSVDTLGAAGGEKASYCQSQVSQEAKTEGYYQKGEAPGVWQGPVEVLAELGLTPGQHITDEHFAAITRGFHPETGEALVQGAGDRHRAGWDLTFSAPKSVSTVWAVATDKDREAIKAAHDKAIQSAFEHLQEQAAYARRGKAGAEQEKLPGLIVAKYPHSTSREQDPDLHTHSLVMNLMQREDGTWGGIESKHFYEWKLAGGAIYRAQLAEEMERLGFKIEADRDYFKITGIPDDLCKEWSKRRDQIEQALAEAGVSGAKASEIAALGSRKAKEQDQDPESLRERWTQEAAEYGLTPDRIAARDLQAEQENDIRPGQEEPQSIYDRLTRTESTFTECDLWAAAAIEMQHQGKGLDAIRTRVDELLAGGEIVRLRSQTGEMRFTTRDMLETERSMAETAKRLQASTAHQVESATVDKALDDFAAAKGFSLSAEQQAAVRHIASTSGSISLVRGAAGAGKSTMAEAARMAWEAEGFKVRGAALAGKAAQGLEDGSHIKSQTLHSLLYEIESGKPEMQLNSKTILVVDEAGMVGSRMMSQLLQHIEAAGAKLVMVGDEAQIQAVDAGGAFKAIQKITGCATLLEIRRQKEAWAREAVEEFSRGEAAQALEKFIDRDLVKIAETKIDAMRNVVDAWHEGRDPSRPGEAVMLASTRADVHTLNQLARAQLKADGDLSGMEFKVTNHNGQKLEFQEGDRLLFRKNSTALDVKNGTLGSIEQIRVEASGEYKFTVKLDNGKTVEFSPNAQNDAYDAIEHGYALTVHKSQGITVDKAFVLVGGSMQDRETTYVQMSRVRFDSQIFFTQSQVEEAADRFLDEPLQRAVTLEDLKHVIQQMEQSRQKDTTLDYTEEPVTIEEAKRKETVIEQEAERKEEVRAEEQQQQEQEAEATDAEVETEMEM